jgi:hypothetical protein
LDKNVTEGHTASIRNTIFWNVTPGSPLKCQLTFDRVHGVISQKILLLITTTVRTSIPTYCFCIHAISGNLKMKAIASLDPSVDISHSGYFLTSHTYACMTYTHLFASGLFMDYPAHTAG